MLSVAFIHSVRCVKNLERQNVLYVHRDRGKIFGKFEIYKTDKYWQALL